MPNVSAVRAAVATMFSHRAGGDGCREYRKQCLGDRSSVLVSSPLSYRHEGRESQRCDLGLIFHF
jgi:hypothetical protein